MSERTFSTMFWAIFGGVALVFVGIFASGLARCGADIAGHTRDVAQREAEKWIRTNSIDAKPDCAARDTDGDGYVSCTLVVTDPDGRKRVMPLECAASMTINEGCRAPKAIIQGQPQ